MKSLKLVLIPAALALVGGACNNATVNTNRSQPPNAQTTSAPTPPDEFAAARINFKKHCEACHGEKATGGIVEIDHKKLKVPSLREGHATGHTDEKLVKQITEGDEEMPAFKDKLKPEEINDLVHFIRKEFQGKQ